jgi:hypothetical protein
VNRRLMADSRAFGAPAINDNQLNSCSAAQEIPPHGMLAHEQVDPQAKHIHHCRPFAYRAT